MTIAFVSVIVTLAIYSSSKPLNLNGSINGVNVELYEDAALSIPLTSMSDLSLDPGSTTQHPFYVYNNGTMPMELSMVIDSSNPSNAGDYISLSLNESGLFVPEKQSMLVYLTIVVAQDPGEIQYFQFNLSIHGTGYS